MDELLEILRDLHPDVILNTVMTWWTEVFWTPSTS